MNLTFRKLNILVVEDENIIAKDIAYTLKRLGHNVTATVSKGEDAVKSSAENKPDLVLMDITLIGEMTGIEAGGIINELYKIPVVYITAHQDQDTIEKSKSTNPYGYITKPLDDRDLNTAINAAIYRHDAEKKLQKIEEKYFRLTENAAVMILSCSVHGNVYNYVNKASIEVTGYSPEEYYSTPGLLNKIILSDWVAFYNEHQMDLSPDGDRTIEFKIRHKSGTHRWLNQKSVITKDDNGVPEFYESIITDITFRKEYENKIEEYNKQLKALASHLQTIREEERTMIAREIHDQLGQDLTVLKMDISLLSKELVKKGKINEIKPIISEFEIMMSTIDRLINTVRKIATELRPDVLDKLGLLEAIQWQAEEFEKRTTIVCTVSFNNSELILSKEKEISLYRVFQESLTNIARHAGATEAVINFNADNNNLVLTIEDNGKGISSKQLQKNTSLGLLGMNERILILGGSLEIKGAKEKGTKVTITVPL